MALAPTPSEESLELYSYINNLTVSVYD